MWTTQVMSFLLDSLMTTIIINQWRKPCIISLKDKNKFSFVTKKCLKLSIASPILSQRERCANMVISSLIHSMTKDIASSILYYGSLVATWSEHEFHYAHMSGIKYTRFAKISQKTSLKTAFKSLTKLKNFHDEYMDPTHIPPHVLAIQLIHD